MSLTIGELVGYVRADDSQFQRVLTQDELRMRGFQRDIDGRLRDIRGRFVSEGRGMGQGLREGTRESGRLHTSLGRLGGMAGALGGVVAQGALMAAKLGAAVPVAAGLAATLANIAPAAAVGATAVFALAQAVAALKIGTSGIGGALSAAFAPSTGGGGGGGGGGAAKQHANALRQLKDAQEQAALANQRAARQVEDAERNLTDAQKAARRAQQDLTAARKEAARELEDMNNQLKDAKLDEEQAVLDVEDAEAELARVRASNSNASDREIAEAQLGYDKAVQSLAEQQTETKRLQSDTDAANKAGAAGSKTVTDAQQQVSDANRDVSDAVRALKDAQEEQARTAKEGLENVKRAQEGLTEAVGGSTGGVNKLNDAMSKLSPSAQAFVRQVIALKPAWDALKLDVQEALFKGLAGELHRTAASVLPVLRTNLVDSARALNDMAKGAAASAREMADNGTLGQAMRSASKGLHNLSGIPGIVVKEFTQIAAAAGPSFEKLTEAAGKGAEKVGKKLDKAFASGAMQKAIEHAIDLIGDLVDIVGNVAKILGSVFDAAEVSGGGFIGVLKTVSGQLAKTFASKPVQDGLKALFETMATLGKTVAPLLDQALRALGPVLAALGPPAQVLIEALGKALQPIIKALGPILADLAGAVGDVVLAFIPLLPVVSDLIVTALTPLSPLIKKISEVFIKIAPTVVKLADKLDTVLTPVMMGLVDVVVQFVEQSGDQLLQLLPDLMKAASDSAPAFVELGKSVGKILTQLAPLLPQITTLAVTMALQLLPALLPLMKPLTELAVLFIKLETAVLVHAIGALTTLVGWFKGLREMLKPAVDAVHWLTTKISDAFEWLSDHLVGHSVIPDMVRSIVAWFAGLPGKAWNALSSFASRIAGRASDAGAAMLREIRSKLSSAVSAIRGLPGRAKDALGDLGNVLYRSGRALIRGFVNGIKSMGSIVADAASALVDKAADFFPHSPAKKGAFSGKGWTLHSGQAVAQAMAAGMRMQESEVSRAARSLAASAQQGIAGADSPLASLVTSPGNAGGGAPAGAASGSGGVVKGEVKVVVDVRGGQDKFVQWLRETIGSGGGGDVQFFLGS
jgi:phage-related protein